MSRHLFFMLLLATGIALADDKPAARHANAEPQAKREAAQGRTEHVQAQTKAAQGQTGEAQAETKEAQGQTEDAHVPTQAAQGRTEHAQAQNEEAQKQTEDTPAQEDAKLASVPGGKALGMSILGNQDAPKSLVIVPWKSSELGDSPGISTMLDDSRQPVDKEVFMRALRYYEIRSEKKP